MPKFSDPSELSIDRAIDQIQSHTKKGLAKPSGMFKSAAHKEAVSRLAWMDPRGGDTPANRALARQRRLSPKQVR